MIAQDDQIVESEVARGVEHEQEAVALDLELTDVDELNDAVEDSERNVSEVDAHAATLQFTCKNTQPHIRRQKYDVTVRKRCVTNQMRRT